MNHSNIYKIVSDKLFELFYVDDHKYGEQQKNGTYKLIKGIITPVTIEDMLINKKSLLTYQELHIVNNALVKWICIDLDISKKEIDNNEVNENNLQAVKKTADLVSDFLEIKEIPHLIECSGRRGFHIWVFFDQLISKENAYYFIQYIFSSVKNIFEKDIVADLFPKVPYTNPNSKGIGYGIKLPLSQNKVSGKLSFLVHKHDFFNFNSNDWLKEVNSDFLEQQLEILNNVQTVSLKQIEPYIKESSKNSVYSKLFPIRQQITSKLPQNITLENILHALRKCENMNRILKDYEKGLGNKERAILVGLLGQLKSTNNPDFGKNILFELFSRIKGFDEKITLKKLETLHYFKPITCKSLGPCSTCEESSISSPIELIDGVQLERLPAFAIENIDKIIFNKIQKSLINYSLKNDEVPLFPQLELIKSIEFNDISTNISQIYNGNHKFIVESYRFQRNEINKTRDLYNIDPVNNFISVYFTFQLNNLFYSEISNNSYGYEFSSSFYKDNLFNNWFINWAKYTKKVENTLYGKEYEDYFLIKLDIKSFYDRIDLKRLKIKLFEEAPNAIKNKLNELDEESINKYKSIIDYLIKLSEKTTGNKDKGLPQGPAFARYLAEIYILGLDSLIENKFIIDQKREFYNRFVDDIFIFVESEERANELFNNIKEWLSINNLEFNNEKTKIINVKEYKESGEYHKFKDNVKYDINFASRNKTLLSEVEIQEAISKLESLTEEVKFGLKDNLRFFYSQFTDNKRLNAIRKKMADILPFSDNGRGALYLMFYSNLVSNFPENFWSIRNKINNIKGLSLTHYLNTILSNEELCLSKKIEIDEIIKSIYQRDDITDADRLLITILKLKTNNQTVLNYNDKISHSALKLPGLELIKDYWPFIKNQLSNLDKNEFLKELEKIILQQTFSKEFLNLLADYAFLRFSEWQSTNSISFLEEESILKQYYQIITFLTLFCESDFKYVNPSWKILLNTSKNLGKFKNTKHQYHWITKIEKFLYTDFSKNSYTLILSNRKGANIGNIDCENEFLEQYRNLLLVLLFDKDKASGTDHFKDDVLKNIDVTDSLFFKWISNTNTTLYPDIEDICLKNIALNGFIVLKNNNTFFVKDIYDNTITSKYNYLNIDDQYLGGKEIEYNLKPERIKDKLKKTNFNDFIKSLNKIIVSHKNFKDKFDANYPYFYQPYDSVSNNPAVPFYSDYEKIINSNGEDVTIDVSTYWAEIVNMLKIEDISNIPLTNENSKYNFQVKDINERFFPISSLLINSETSKINFIEAFISNISSDNTIFQYQYDWSVTVFKLSQKLNNSNNPIINYLKIHFDTFNGDNLAIDILFSIDENLVIKNKTLEDFCNTILSSLSTFTNQIQQGEIDFVQIVDNYIPTSFNTNFTPLKRNDLEKSDIEIKVNKNLLSQNDSYTLIINGKKYEATEAYYFNNLIQEFQLESLGSLYDKIKGNDFFITTLENQLFIYVPEIEILKCYDRISKRKSEVYDTIFSTTSSDNLNDYVEYINLFPKNTNYANVKAIVEGLSELDEIKSKLNCHLNNSFNSIDRTINWLTLFNDDSIEGSELKNYMDKKGYNLSKLYRAILFVLNKHVFISKEDIKFFKENLEERINDKNNIIFSLKNYLSDSNGLKRLMDKVGFEERKIDLLTNFDKLCSNTVSKKLIIISDIFISGSQTKKALEYYLKTDHKDEVSLIQFNDHKPSKNSRSPIEERYFTFNSLEKSNFFLENFKFFEEIIFVSPLMTKKFQTNMKIFLKDINPKLSFKTNNLLDEESYLLGQININKEDKELFIKLLTDEALISKIFNVKNKEYSQSINSLEKRNLILRIKSLPTQHIYLFTLLPKRGGPSLLDYVKNW